MSKRKKNLKKQSDRNIGSQKKASAINIEQETINLLNDSVVQRDRVVRLAMLSILGLYFDGVPKDEITRLEVMNAIFFMNVIENYRPELARELSLNEFSIMGDRFCEGLKDIVMAMFIRCLNDKSELIDKEKIITLRNTLLKDTWVSKE